MTNGETKCKKGIVYQELPGGVIQFYYNPAKHPVEDEVFDMIDNRILSETDFRARLDFEDSIIGVVRLIRNPMLKTSNIIDEVVDYIIECISSTK